MSTIKIPTPLRAYTGGNAEIEVAGETVGAAIGDLVTKYPDLRQHLYNGNELRNFINIFLGEEDIRYRDGLDTPLEKGENLRIIPSIAGGSGVSSDNTGYRAQMDVQNNVVDRKVDHSALRTNQTFIISLLILAFLLPVPVLVAFVAAVMLIGTIIPSAGLFKLIYFKALKPGGLVKPDVKVDNPEPHLFAQGVGGAMLLLASILLFSGSGVGWVLSWIVVALAALNLFAGICVGCIMYYGLHRLGVPGFKYAPVQR